MAIKLKKEEEIKKIKKESLSNDGGENKTSFNTIDSKSINAIQDRPLTKKEKKALKRNTTSKRSIYEKFTLTFIVFLIIFAVTLGLYAATPVISIILGIFVLIGLIAFCMLITVVSFGLLWMSEGLRNVVGSMSKVMTTLFSFGDKAIDFLYPSFIYVSSIGGAFALLSLIFSIVGYHNHKKDERNSYKTHMIVSIIFSVLLITFIVVDIFIYYGTKK